MEDKLTIKQLSKKLEELHKRYGVTFHIAGKGDGTIRIEQDD